MNKLPWLYDAFDPVKFELKQKEAIRQGWSGVTWLNGYTVGHPPKRPWINPFQLYTFHMPIGQLEFNYE